MLGFSALSETPLGQAVTSLAALGYLPTTAVTASAGSVSVKTEANITQPSVSAITYSGTLQDIDAKATITLSSVNISGTVATPTTIAEANITAPAATAALSVGSIDQDAKAKTTLTAITAALNVNGHQIFDAQATLDLGSVTVSTSSTDVTASGIASIALSAATASLSANDVDQDAKANITINAVEASADLTVNDFADEDAQASKTLPSVSATLTVNDFADVAASSNVTLSGLALTGNVNLSSPTAVVFDYSTVADEYGRDRVIYVLEPNSNNTVYILP